MFRFFIFIILILTVLSIIISAKNIDIANSIIFALIGIQSAIAMLFFGPSGHSLIKSIFFFNFIFFSMVPLIELENSHVYWGGTGIENIQYSWVGLLIFFANIIVLITYSFNYSYPGIKPTEFTDHFKLSNRPIYQLNPFHSFLILMIVLFVAFLVFATHNYNFISLLVRGGDIVLKSYESTTDRLLFEGFLRLIPFCILLALVSTVQKSGTLKILILVIAVLCAFPTAISRLRVPALYMSLAIFLFPWLLNKTKILTLYIFGFIYAFPLLENFRYFSNFEDFEAKFNLEFLLAGHFDAFQNFVRMVYEVNISYGYQLIGALFFWVPRSFWEEKPIGSGAALANDLGYSFTNISATWFAEGWINFGIVGVFIFAIFLGYFSGKLDRGFWVKGIGTEMSVYYIIFTGYILFLMRGDLLSGFAFLIGFLLAQFIGFRLLRPLNIIK